MMISDKIAMILLNVFNVKPPEFLIKITPTEFLPPASNA